MSNHFNQSPEETARDRADKAKELSNAYLRLFGTPDGQKVQEDLNKWFLLNAVPENADHAYWSGAKGVMTHIINHQIAGNR